MGQFDFKIDIIKSGITKKSELTAHILRQLFLDEIDSNKTVIVALTGKTSRGKSLACLSIQLILYAFRNLDFRHYMKTAVVFVPFDYPACANAALDKHSGQFTIQIDEGRETVGAKNWQDFSTKAIAAINNQCRAIKPLLIFVVAQSMKDILKDTRIGLDYQLVFDRGKTGPAKAKIFKFYIDENDPEKPRLKRARVYGFIRNGSRVSRVFPILSFKMPPEDMVKEYKKMEQEKKWKIIKGRLEMILERMGKEFGQVSDKVSSLIEYYSNNQELLKGIVVKIGKRKIRMRKDFLTTLNLNREEEKDFLKRLRERIGESKDIVAVEGDII